MEKAIWSHKFAQELAQTIGYAPADYTQELEQIVENLCEMLRYLPPNKIQLARDFAGFLRGRPPSPCVEPQLQQWRKDNLLEVCDVVAFLKEHYGHEQPAEESDEWTEEDRRDATLAALRRSDEEAPYHWEDADGAKAG